MKQLRRKSSWLQGETGIENYPAGVKRRNPDKNNRMKVEPGERQQSDAGCHLHPEADES